jgi:hypothetical protein
LSHPLIEQHGDMHLPELAGDCQQREAVAVG